jgi:hypothetical protein
MCYSLRTSLISYALGMSSAVFALCTKQYILGMLILFYCQMQASEAMIWKGIDDNNVPLNKGGTKYGQYLLPSHLFAVGLGYLLAEYFVQKKAIKPHHFVPVLVGLIFYFVIIFGPYRTEKYEDVTYPADKNCKDKSCQNNGNRLQWPYPHSWYVYGYILCIIFTIICVKPFWSKIYISALFTISFILSCLIYPKSVGSFWCFSAAIIAPLLVIGNYLIIRNNPNTQIFT